MAKGISKGKMADMIGAMSGQSAPLAAPTKGSIPISKGKKKPKGKPCK